MQDLDWDDLRVALAVARAGTMAGAGRVLGVDETTIARRLARLEARLGRPLFVRDGRRRVPDGEAAPILAAAERAEAAIGTAVEGGPSGVAGRVRVTTVPALAAWRLIPALPSLLAVHPDLSVEILAEPRNLGLMRRDADIALRLARPRDEPDLLARRIGDVPFAAFCARGAEAGAETLPWIGYATDHKDLPQARWLADQGRRESALAVNDALILAEAVAAGSGRGLLPAWCPDPRLARISDPVLTRELWLLVHPDLRRAPRIRAVLDWLESLTMC